VFITAVLLGDGLLDQVNFKGPAKIKEYKGSDVVGNDFFLVGCMV
jgi:hypothetical protein